jgi:hypothetical protein
MHNLQIKKQSLTLLLLLIAMAPLTCLFLYQVQLCYNRFEMLERLEEESLHAITIPSEDIHWLIPGKELRLGKRLFDVKKIQDNDSTIIVTGIFDDEEETLEKQLSEQSGSENSSLPFLLKIMITPVITCSMRIYQPFALPKEKISGNWCNTKLPFSFSDPVYPPPQANTIIIA